jgi:hypothetical protein
MTENERLPSGLGWTKKADVVNLEDITRISDIIRNATGLLTASVPAAARRRGLHSGFIFQSGQ